MRNIWLLAFIFVSLSSCGTYRYNGYTTNKVNVVPYDNSWYFYNAWWNVQPLYLRPAGWPWNSYYYTRPLSRPQVRREVLPRTRRRNQETVRGRRNEINPNYLRSQKQTQGGDNGRRGRSGQVNPTQQTRPSVSSPRQPGQVRGGSRTPGVQQSQPRSSSGRSGGGRPIKQ